MTEMTRTQKREMEKGKRFPKRSKARALTILLSLVSLVLVLILSLKMTLLNPKFLKAKVITTENVTILTQELNQQVAAGMSGSGLPASLLTNLLTADQLRSDLQAGVEDLLNGSTDGDVLDSEKLVNQIGQNLDHQATTSGFATNSVAYQTLRTNFLDLADDQVQATLQSNQILKNLVSGVQNLIHGVQIIWWVSLGVLLFLLVRLFFNQLFNPFGWCHYLGLAWLVPALIFLVLATFLLVLNLEQFLPLPSQVQGVLGALLTGMLTSLQKIAGFQLAIAVVGLILGLFRRRS